ncbi:MAG: AAA family ATPase [Verrucomicrobiota bacterium]
MPFLSDIRLEDLPASNEHPFSIAAVRALAKTPLPLHPKVTFLVGENGAGKSTLLEAIADKWGFANESGDRDRSPNLRAYSTALAPHLRMARSIPDRPLDGFYLRAESLFNFATELDELEREHPNGYFRYGGASLHQQSHGESFLSLFLHRFGEHGLYLLDEPEAALSPSRQLTILVRLHDLARAHCQFIIATHSPIIMAYPDAWIYEISDEGISQVPYEDTDHFQITHRFLTHRERMLQQLLEDEPE